MTAAPTPETRPSRARRLRTGLTVAFVLALAGLMFTASARLAQGDESRHPENLAQLVDRESERVADLAAQVDALDDAPAGDYGSSFPPDTLVVHQQDIQAVVNALWAGGAEAMTLQGQRVTATTAFRCAGNILLLHGRVYSPPYVVEAVGDPDRLRDALDRSERIDIYKEYVDAVNLGWSVEEKGSIEMPRFEGALDLRYARASETTP